MQKNRHHDVDRLDMETVDMHERVRQGYLSMLDRYPNRIVKVDASQELELVIADALAIITERFFKN